jgi:hypothetical protein
MGPTALEVLLALLDSGYDVRSWHGPNLRGALRGVNADLAAWRPAPGRHNIWEHVVHAAYWKYAVRRRLRGEKRSSFPLKGSDWFVRPDESGRTLADDLALLGEMHTALREAVAALSPAALLGTPVGSRVRCHALVAGVAAHDVYHAGQIQLVKKLAASSGLE